MAEKVGNISFPAGKYIKDGEEKTRWMTVGVLIRTNKGLRIKLDAIPVVTGDNGLWLNVFEDDHNPRQQRQEAPAPSQAAPGNEPQPEIPF